MRDKGRPERPIYFGGMMDRNSKIAYHQEYSPLEKIMRCMISKS